MPMPNEMSQHDRPIRPSHLTQKDSSSSSHQLPPQPQEHKSSGGNFFSKLIGRGSRAGSSAEVPGHGGLVSSSSSSTTRTGDAVGGRFERNPSQSPSNPNSSHSTPSTSPGYASHSRSRNEEAPRGRENRKSVLGLSHGRTGEDVGPSTSRSSGVSVERGRRGSGLLPEFNDPHESSIERGPQREVPRMEESVLSIQAVLEHRSHAHTIGPISKEKEAQLVIAYRDVRARISMRREDDQDRVGLGKEEGDERDSVLAAITAGCSSWVPETVRTAAFIALQEFLKDIHLGRAATYPEEDQEEEERGYPRSKMVELVQLTLTLPTSTPHSVPFTGSDLLPRINCLRQLTNGGKDIALELGMVRVIVSWSEGCARDWVRECMDLTGVGVGVGMGVGEGKKGGLGLAHDEGARGRDASVATIVPSTSNRSSGSTVLQTILALSDFLLDILTNNLPLFTPADTSRILNLYLDTIKRGIRHTPGSHPLQTPGFLSYGKWESKPKMSVPQGDRSGSVLGTHRRGTKVAPTAAITTESPSSAVSPTTGRSIVPTTVPPALSRHPSVRSKGEKGLATTAITTSEEVVIDLPPVVVDEKPLWSTMIPFLIQLLRFLLKAKSLSPLDLPGIMSLLSLSLGWRAMSTTATFRTNSGDRAVVTNALDLRDRDAIVSLVRDVIVSQMIGRSGEKALRGVLGMDRGRGRERSTYLIKRDDGLRGRDRLLGVICLVRELLKTTHHANVRADSASHNLSADFTLVSFAPSLLSAMRFSHKSVEAETAEFADAWHDVDLEILGVVDDHLKDLEHVVNSRQFPPDLAMAGSFTQDSKSHALRIRDAWTEGELICEFLERAKRWITSYSETDGTRLTLDDSALRADRHEGVPAVNHRLARLFLKLPKVLGQMQSSSSFNGFFHPDYVDILIQMSNHITDDTALDLLQYYEREGICLPPTEQWTANINRILAAFYIVVDREGHSASGKLISQQLRRRTAELVFKHVYEYVQEFTDLRNQMVKEVLLVLSERTLQMETDPVIENMAWSVVIDFVVADSVEKDEQRRAHRLELEQMGQTVPPAPLAELVGGDSFDRIRALSLKCFSDDCSEHNGGIGKKDRTASNPPPRSEAMMATTRNESTEEHSRTPSAGILKGIFEAISPTSGHKELPPIGGRSGMFSPSSETEHLASPTTESISEMLSDHAEEHNPVVAPSVPQPCKHSLMILNAIAIFTRLAFSLPSTIKLGRMRVGRLPASARCIIIYKDLIRLLAPHPTNNRSLGARNESPSGRRDSRSSEPEVPTICPKARLTILQWLMRLRANQEHRIWLKQVLDDSATPLATILSRMHTQADALKHSRPVDEAEPRRRPVRPEIIIGDRGRLDRSMQDGTGRSRSRSRQPARVIPYAPLWGIPDQLEYEAPPNERPSEGMTTYDPRLTEDGNEEAGSTGIWLPISDYLATINDILEHDSDWEMVSYILVFLPLQLANKHFFCGPRTKPEIRRLRSIICEGLLTDRLIQNVQLPPMLRKADIRGVAYQTLNLMISYKRLFDRNECNKIVETLYKGLSGIHRSSTKPCIRSLTLVAYELTDNLVTYLPGILDQLGQIMGTPAISVHILEFLGSIGQIPSLYGNFTDMQYKTVFQVAMKYIEIHHDKENKALADATQVNDPEYFTLSQHVLKLSFYVIYTWYMALALPKRVIMYPHILRQLNLSFPNGFDEMAEVCFDWLARYTYGNADPKPAASHIGNVAMHNSSESPLDSETQRTKYWILGNSIISITAHPRNGWATLNVRRASGNVGILMKIENVPTIGLGEDGADLEALPAMMRGDRREERESQDNEGALTPGIQSQATAADQDNAVVAVSPMREHDSQFSFIWSGSAPSQRRKDVVIDPSFVGLQLSAYPYISVQTPRGRFLPLDSTVERTLRNLDRIPVIDTQGIAVLYAGPDQSTEDEILSNTNGSPAFLRFMAGLGRLIKLKGQKDVYTGGLDTIEDRDGEYAYAWWDDLIQVIYHAPHLMPNPITPPGDKPNYYTKKREVGNDYVKIIFNDSGLDYAFDTIKSQFQFVNIVISAHTAGVAGTFKDNEDHDNYLVTIQRAPGIPDFAAIGDFKLVSAKSLPMVVRQIGFYATMISQLHLHTSTQGNLEYLTAWRQRWQKIQSLKTHLPKPPNDEEIGSMSELDMRQQLRDFTRGF